MRLYRTYFLHWLYIASLNFRRTLVEMSASGLSEFMNGVGIGCTNNDQILVDTCCKHLQKYKEDFDVLSEIPFVVSLYFFLCSCIPINRSSVRIQVILLRQLPVSLGLLLNIHLRALIKVFIAKRNYIGPLHEQRVEFMPNSMVSKCCCVLLRLML